MERYAVSWPDVGADPNDGFDGFSTARFATLREAVPCASTMMSAPMPRRTGIPLPLLRATG